jgi:transposase
VAKEAQMQYIAMDAHKKYTLVSVEPVQGGKPHETRINHEPGMLRGFLERMDSGSPVAVETVGNWYWIVDEIEAAGMVPQLVHARKAKMMMGNVNKTDKLDAQGLNRLQRNGTLPTVWIPSAELRDKRDLARTRMALVAQRTQLKNRIHATLAKYGLSVEVSDLFGKKGRELMGQALQKLPPETQFSSQRTLETLDALKEQIEVLEGRMKEVFEETEEVRLLKTLPGVGFILSVVMSGEIGEIGRFSCADRLASYSGTTPRVAASGGKTRYGGMRTESNQYLKWAFIEAANCVCLNRKKNPKRTLSCLYDRIRSRKGHGKAIGAVARNLAEAAFWVLKKKEPYRDPATESSAVLPTKV